MMVKSKKEINVYTNESTSTGLASFTGNTLLLLLYYYYYYNDVDTEAIPVISLVEILANSPFEDIDIIVDGELATHLVLV